MRLNEGRSTQPIASRIVDFAAVPWTDEEHEASVNSQVEVLDPPEPFNGELPEFHAPPIPEGGIPAPAYVTSTCAEIGVDNRCMRRPPHVDNLLEVDLGDGRLAVFNRPLWADCAPAETFSERAERRFRIAKLSRLGRAWPRVLG